MFCHEEKARIDFLKIQSLLIIKLYLQRVMLPRDYAVQTSLLPRSQQRSGEVTRELQLGSLQWKAADIKEKWPAPGRAGSNQRDRSEFKQQIFAEPTGTRQWGRHISKPAVALWGVCLLGPVLNSLSFNCKNDACRGSWCLVSQQDNIYLGHFLHAHPRLALALFTSGRGPWQS